MQHAGMHLGEPAAPGEKRNSRKRRTEKPLGRVMTKKNKQAVEGRTLNARRVGLWMVGVILLADVQGSMKKYPNIKPSQNFKDYK